MRVFSQINNCQQKQNKKTKQKTDNTKRGAPLLGLAKSIYYQNGTFRSSSKNSFSFAFHYTLFVSNLSCVKKSSTSEGSVCSLL